MVDQYPLVTQLFQEQCKKWESIAIKHTSAIYRSTLSHLYLAVDHFANQDTSIRVKSELIQKPMSEKSKQLTAKVKELVAPYQHWTPITMNSDYKVKVFQQGACTFQQVDLLANEPGEKQAAEQYAWTLNHLQAYYDVSSITCRMSSDKF